MAKKLPIEDRLRVAGELVVRTRMCFDLWFYFEERSNRSLILDTLNLYPTYFRVTVHSYLVSFLVQLVALFESRSDRISLPELAKELRGLNRLTAEGIQAVEILFGLAEPTVRKARILRHNLFAHRSATISYEQAFEMAQVTPNQLSELSELSFKIVNRLLDATAEKQRYTFDLAREEAKEMIEALSKFSEQG